ncbi:MAG: hypothetical protein WCK67_10290 [bacterium]
MSSISFRGNLPINNNTLPNNGVQKKNETLKTYGQPEHDTVSFGSEKNKNVDKKQGFNTKLALAAAGALALTLGIVYAVKNHKSLDEAKGIAKAGLQTEQKAKTSIELFKEALEKLAKTDVTAENVEELVKPLQSQIKHELHCRTNFDTTIAVIEAYQKAGKKEQANELVQKSTQACCKQLKAIFDSNAKGKAIARIDGDDTAKAIEYLAKLRKLTNDNEMADKLLQYHEKYYSPSESRSAIHFTDAYEKIVKPLMETFQKT